MKLKYIMLSDFLWEKGILIMFMFKTTTRGSSGILNCNFVFFLCYTVLFTYKIWIYKKEKKERKEYKMITNVFLPFVLFWSWFVCWFAQETKIFEGILKYSLYLSILLTSTFMRGSALSCILWEYKILVISIPGLLLNVDICWSF